MKTSDSICEAFEQAWRDGQPCSIEEALRGVPEEVRVELFDRLLEIEARYRKARLHSTADQQGPGRFPDLTSRSGGSSPRDSSVHSNEATTIKRTADSMTPTTETTEPEPLPLRLGPYEIRQELGSGRFGRVCQAWDVDTQRFVAIKLPHARVVAALGGTEQYIAEARHLAQLDHAGIVRLHHVGRFGSDGVYLVTEFIQGETLAEFVCRQSGRVLPPLEAARILADVADALHHAHRRRFVHRDLKPANILIDQQGQPHIADFGLAVPEWEQGRRAGEIAGTPAYMSPEQWEGDVHLLDGRADIWSAGVILYELLTGCRPFIGNSLEELSELVRRKPARPLRMVDDRIPAELERITLRCLQKSAGERYLTAADLATDLRSWIASQSGAAGAPQQNSSTLTRPAAGSASSLVAAPVRWLVAAGAVLLLASVLVMGLVKKPGPQPGSPARSANAGPATVRGESLTLEAAVHESAHEVPLRIPPSGRYRAAGGPSKDSLSVLTWNTEGGDSSPTVNSLRIVELGRQDLWALAEVEGIDAARRYQGAMESAAQTEVEAIVGTTGGSDLLMVGFDWKRFQVLDVRELHHPDLPSPNRSPLAVKLRDRARDEDFWFVANHFSRASPAKSELASWLRRFVEKEPLPVIATGDFNLEWDVEWGDMIHDPAYDLLTEGRLMEWVRPETLIATHSGTPEMVLDFTFVSREARFWEAACTIIPAPGDFPDSNTTSDHRPLRTVFQFSSSR